MRFSLIFCLILVVSSAQILEDDSEDNSEDEEDSEEDYSVEENAADLSSLQTFLNEVIRENRTQGLNSTLIDDLVHMQMWMSRATDALFRTFFPLISDWFQTSDISLQCTQTLFRGLQALRSQKEWPLKFLDSSARFLFSGLLDGRISDFGEYAECLRIRETVNSDEIRGKYCLTSISLRLPPLRENLTFHEEFINVENTSLRDTVFTRVAHNTKLFYMARGLRLGLCVPNTCSSDDLRLMSLGLTEALRLEVRIPEKCETSDEEIVWTLQQKTSLSLLSFLALLSLVSCAAPNRNQLFRAFAVTESLKRLFLNDTRTKRLAAIHGLRVVAILWILLGHAYLMQFFEVFHVLRGILVDWPRLAWIRYQPLKLGAFLQVDTFLLLGGVTASYVTLDILSTVKRFDWFAFLLFRWLRYTPALIGLILLYFLLPLLASGPIYKDSIQVITNPCEHFWWRNLLYVNNFYDSSENCATHTWYLAVDFQLYALSPLLILLLQKRPTLGISFTVAVILLGAPISIAAPLLDPLLDPSLYTLNSLLSEEHISRNFRLLYWSTAQHVSPYFMGVLLGFLIHKYDCWKVPRKIELLIWALCVSSGVWTVFWTTTWMDPTAPYESPSYAWRLFFTATHKITWTVLPFWLVLTSAFGRPGPIGRFFSWHGWVPLSRLTYTLYLVQLIPIVVRSYSVHHVLPFDDFYNWSLASFCFILSLLLAFVVFALFESPFSHLINVCLKNNKK